MTIHQINFKELIGRSGTVLPVAQFYYQFLFFSYNIVNSWQATNHQKNV